VFLSSSAGKIADPSAFAAIVANYQLLPPPLVSATAVIFPWIELTCGLALVLGRLEKGAALLVSLMMVVFIAIILIQWLSGIEHCLRLFFIVGQSAVQYCPEYPAQFFYSGGRGVGAFLFRSTADDAAR
jgi:uncharacterized membrane protein YphA (DoxX/SURF4 family)